MAFSATISVQASELSQEHIDWCTQQHPSYNAATNEYAAGSSINKKCSSPYDDSDIVDGDENLRTFDASATMDEATSQRHQDWCIARYPSYDASTNTYDTGRSGIQKYCSSPYN